MFVLMEDAAQAIVVDDVQVRGRVWIGGRFGWRVQWPGFRDPPMGPMGVVMPLQLAVV
jgi:hypothetical protein